MSLTLEQRRRLLAKSFDKLFQQHHDKWNEMIDNAVDYANKYIKGADKVHPGDVVELLLEPLKLDPDFSAHVTKLPQQMWVKWFAEYILEQRYPPPELA